MFKTLLVHELLLQLKSRRAIWAVSIFMLLFSVIFYVRIEDFSQRKQAYLADVQQASGSLEKAYNYSNINLPAIKPPVLFSIYNEGVTHNKGTNILTQFFRPIMEAGVKNSSTNYIFKSNNRIDITFLVTFFLSLLIFIITFDAINGEKEQGTLRMLFTYPVKRPVYLLKKILGVTGFVGLVFMIPYFISLIAVAVIYGDMAGSGFYITAILYLLLTLIYIFTMAMIGILMSLLTRYPGRSLIYSLAIWIMLTVVASPLYTLFSATLTKPQKRIELSETLKTMQEFRNKDLDRVDNGDNPALYGHWNWNGTYLTNMSVFGEKSMYDAHASYVKHYYETYYETIKKEEQIYREIENLKHNSKKWEPYVLFFNPSVLFESAAAEISGTSFEEYNRFVREAIDLKEQFTEMGARDGWLFTDAFFNMYDPGSAVKSTNDYAKELFPDIYDQLETMSEEEQRPYFPKIQAAIMNDMNSNKNTFKLPDNLPKYRYQPAPLSQILEKVMGTVMIILLFSVILFILNQLLFKRYDLR